MHKPKIIHFFVIISDGRYLCDCDPGSTDVTLSLTRTLTRSPNTWRRHQKKKQIYSISRAHHNPLETASLQVPQRYTPDIKQNLVCIEDMLRLLGENGSYQPNLRTFNYKRSQHRRQCELPTMSKLRDSKYRKRNQIHVTESYPKDWDVYGAKH